MPGIGPITNILLISVNEPIYQNLQPPPIDIINTDHLVDLPNQRILHFSREFPVASV